MSSFQLPPADRVNGRFFDFHNLPSSPPSTATRQPSMLSTPPANPTMQSKGSSIPIASLISPPEEKKYESFGHGPQSPTTKPVFKPAQHPSSPPVSPWSRASNQVTTTTADRHARDVILYPEGSTGEAQPLFPTPDDGAVIDAHIAARKESPLPPHVKPPTRAEYEMVLQFLPLPKPDWADFRRLKTNEDWDAYHRQQYAEAKADDKLRKEYRESQQSINNERRKVASPQKRPSDCFKHKPSNNRPIRPLSSGGSNNSSNAVLDSATGPRSPTKITKSTTSRTGRLFAAPVRLDSSSPMELPLQARKMAKKVSKSSKAQVSDTKFDHIPDYCPPISSIGNKQLKIESEKAPREFTETDKEFLPLLHPAEQELAQREQLSAASYLTTKRRIFVDRLYFYHFEKEQLVEQAKGGKKEKPFVKNFSRTHAQEAGKIDVNKTSRLWSAFNSVGWFDAKWFKEYPKPTFDNRLDKHFTAEDIQRNGLPGPQKHFKRGVN